jgi:hypothetical protein
VDLQELQKVLAGVLNIFWIELEAPLRVVMQCKKPAYCRLQAVAVCSHQLRFASIPSEAC